MPPVSDASSATAADPRIRAEQIALLARQLPGTVLAGTVVAVLATIGAWHGAGGPPLAIWVATYLVVSALRLATPRFYRHDHERDRHWRQWSRVFTANFAASGAMWLVFGLITARPEDARQTLFVSIVLVGMTAASLATLAVYRPAHMAFAILTMIGFILPNAASGVTNGLVLAMMAVVYLVVNILGGRSAERALMTSIALRYDKERLISELHERHERAQQLAIHDALTQLPNRILLADRLQQAVLAVSRRQTRVAVCYLDLDGFKHVNDSYGHEAGDRLLVEIASRLQATARRQDTVARLGGDEFVIVLGDLHSAAECDAGLARVMEALAEPCTVAPGVQTSISGSIGVSFCPDDGADPDSLLRQADQAMYQAKQAGRNRIYRFAAIGPTTAPTPRSRRERLRGALDRREFVLHWQPKVDMRLGKVVGAEALIRWVQPDGQVLLPADFLPEIEDDPLIVAIGDWVLDEALLALERWQAVGSDLKVSVNVAARQLLDPDFVGKLRRAVAARTVAVAGRLEMEILETVALRDLVRVNAVMQECRALGVDFALDDFGTGYSSITYFRRLPAATVKIDQSFVRDMLEDRDDLAIVEGILGMTTAFERKVVAEGVEKPEHGAALLRLGCDVIQGFALARPMPEADFLTWLDQFTPDPAWWQGGTA